MAKVAFASLALAFTAVMGGGPAAAEADLAKGEVLFKKHQCAICHKLEPGKNLVGPSLAGVWGRKVGEAPGFKYSDALVQSGIVWDEASLDTWINDPKALVKGTKMLMAKPVKDEADRETLIAYLKKVTSP